MNGLAITVRDIAVLFALVIQIAIGRTAAPANAQSWPDGEILNSQSWPALPSWESLDDFTHNYFPRAVYEEAQAQQNFDVLDIIYSTDGLPVRGMLIRPKNPGNRKWPALIFNRGGTGDYGRIGNYGVPSRFLSFAKDREEMGLEPANVTLV